MTGRPKGQLSTAVDSAPCVDRRLADGHPGENDWSASAQDASKNLINNDFLKNCKEVWLDVRTIPDLQELDKQVSRRHKRLPFLHLFLFGTPFISPFCLSTPPPTPHPLQCQSQFSSAMGTASGKPWLFWENWFLR